MKFKSIVIEGIDGSGKTLIASQISETYGFKYTCEPCKQKCKIGELIRSNFKEIKAYPGIAKIMLFSACRFNHLPAVGEQKRNSSVTVYDRSFLSTIVYNNHSKEEYRIASSLAECSLKRMGETIIILLDLPIDEALRRISKRGTYEYFSKEELQIFRERYLDYLALFTDICEIRIIDATKNPDKILAEISEVINQD